MITKLISKLHIDRYFSSKLILCIDLCASVIASVVVLMFAKLIIPASQLDEETVLYFLLSAAAASFVTFYLMKTNHSIIRHSTLRELAKLFIAVLGKEILISLLYLVPSFRNDGFVYILILDLTLSFTFLLLLILPQQFFADKPCGWLVAVPRPRRHSCIATSAGPIRREVRCTQLPTHFARQYKPCRTLPGDNAKE